LRKINKLIKKNKKEKNIMIKILNKRLKITLEQMNKILILRLKIKMLPPIYKKTKIRIRLKILKI